MGSELFSVSDGVSSLKGIYASVLVGVLECRSQNSSLIRGGIYWKDTEELKGLLGRLKV